MYAFTWSCFLVMIMNPDISISCWISSALPARTASGLIRARVYSIDVSITFVPRRCCGIFDAISVNAGVYEIGSPAVQLLFAPYREEIHAITF